MKRRLRRRAPPGGPLFAAEARQRRLDHRLQGLVPDRRRRPRRPADARRRLQPLSAALPGGGAPRHRRTSGRSSTPPSASTACRSAALRQRPALRDRGRGRALAARGAGDQGRGHARADHPRQAAGERPPRADAPDAAARTPPIRRPPPCAPQAGRFREFQRIYNEERPHAALGNATPADRYAPSPRRWDGVLRSPEPMPATRSAGCGARARSSGAAARLHQRGAGRRAGRPRRDRGRPLDGALRPDPARLHRASRRPSEAATARG